MDHGASALNSTFLTFSNASMDLDFMDKSVSQGCWLETTDRINFLEPEPFISSVQEHVAETTLSLLHPEISQPEGSDSGRWFIDQVCSVKDRLMIAIEYMKGYVEESDVLIQIWMPTNRGGQNVLTTNDQPYSLNPNCKSLANYRNVSKTFHLTAEEDLKESAGLPGRVFLGKLPEWTPDVRFFRSDECPRKNYAKLYKISGCLALPVFEKSSGICLAVIEIVTTTQKINYHPEVDIVCKALQAVDLKSSQDFFPLGIKACNQLYQTAVPEISDTLRSVCETFRLPLAVTWALCDWQGEREHQKFLEKFDYFLSTVDSACYVADDDLLGFLEACSEQYFFLDQGIVGKAFTTNKQCFATDITSFSKTNYPLSHHAKIFNLGAAVAIPLRNMYTGLVEYVLELFLPRDCKDFEEQKQMWDLLPVAIQQACRSFHVVMDRKLDDAVHEHAVVDLDGWLTEDGIQKFVSSPSEESSYEESSWIQHEMDTQKTDKCAFISWECPKEEPEDELEVTAHWDNNELNFYRQQVVEGLEQQSSVPKLEVGGRDNSCTGQYRSLSSKRAGEKKQTKIDKTISLQILRQYFAGSLKDAAKSIGVCPTTLKRICRQHGINRWPSRKIQKVNHSLRKLQQVVNSIRGAEGLIQIDSFYKTFPELGSSNASGKGPFSSIKENDDSNNLNPHSERALFRRKADDSKSQSSSSGQNSGSSIRYSTETKQLNNSSNNDLKNGSIAIEDLVLALKRTCREAELNSLNVQEEPKILSGFHSHKPLDSASCQDRICTGKNLRHGMSFRVKATFEDENIRFGFMPNWAFKDLQQEIAKRFKIEDFTGICLKYLDIDHEPVLLTCDADLDECIDLLSSFQSNTIKITLHQASRQPILMS